MRRIGLLALALLAIRPLQGQEPPFVTRSEYLALIGQISGDAAYEHLRYTTQFHKPEGSEGLMEVARYVESQARTYALDSVRLLRQSDVGPAWNARSAELWIDAQSDTSRAPEWRRWASLRQNQLHLADRSRSADVATEIVDVGSGADSASYAGKDVRGKLVLAYGPTSVVARLAVRERGAAGIVWRPGPAAPRSLDYPDQIGWNFVPDYTFAFVLSSRQGTQLAQLLARGGRRARATVETVTDSTQRWQVMVEGVLLGTDPSLRAVVLTGHMQEEKFSANDDGSGVANVLEIARALGTLVRSGELPRPRRTIRFWWTTEIGSERQYFADHPEEMARLWLNINQDMVGANQGQDVMRVQNITRLPWTRAHFLDEVADATISWLVEANGQQLSAAQVPWRPGPIYSHLGTRHRYNAALIPFHTSTDHMTFIEPPVGLPGITFTNWPDNYIHSSDDDLWNIDRTQLERNAVAVAMMTVFMARAANADVPALVAATTGRGMQRVAEAYRLAAGWLLAADSAHRAEAYRQGKSQIEVVTAVVAQDVRSIGDVATADLPQRLIARGAAQVEADGRARLADLDQFWRDSVNRPPPAAQLTATELRLQQMRPAIAGTPADFLQRNVEGTPGLHPHMGFEVGNAVDGQRTGLDIYRLVGAEARAAGAHYYGVVTPESVERALQALQQARLIRMAER